MKTAAIDLNALASVSAFASKEQARYYLGGVCLEITARATIYVATDGHRLVAHRIELHKDAESNTLLGSFIVPLDKCKAIKFRHDSQATVSGEGFDLAIAFEGSTVGFKCIDGTFPDWRRVLGTTGEDDRKDFTFNASYLHDLQKFGKAMDLGAFPYVAQNGGNPAFVWFGEGDSTVAVIMPVRSKDYSKRALPEWVNATPEAAPMLEAAE